MKVRIHVRMVTPRQAFKPSTFVALIEAEEDGSWFKFGDNMGRTRQYDTWEEAATHGMTLAVSKQFGRFDITNFDLIAAKVTGF